MSDIFTVERIVGSRARGRKRQYLVKWEGYPSEENTWENEENIFCKELIAQYERTQKKKGTKAPKKAAKPPPPKAKLSRVVTNEWHDLVRKVLSVEKDKKTGGILVQLLFVNGEKGAIPAPQVHTYCPLHLIDYYEKNLVFNDDEG
jgi:chromobox protein 1